MTVYHFCGQKDVNTVEDLNSVLNIRTENDANEFLLSGSFKYPYLSILINGDYATAIYVSDKTGGILQSVGDGLSLNMDKTTTFFTGTKEQEICVWNEYVLSVEKAKAIAIEFFLKYELPTCVKWSEE